MGRLLRKSFGDARRKAFPLSVTLVSGKNVNLRVSEEESLRAVGERLKKVYGTREADGVLAAEKQGLWMELSEKSTVSDVALTRDSSLRILSAAGPEISLRNLGSQESLSSLRQISGGHRIHPL